MKEHWPEYLSEAACLAMFMVSACLMAAVLEDPGSPVRQAIADGRARRAVMGIAMGATAIALIYSPWGQRSGAHMNPAVTLTYYHLGKIAGRDAAGYMLAQFAGGYAGVKAAVLLAGPVVSSQPVHFVVTEPGVYGAGAAFAAEFVISMVLMLAVLSLTNSGRLAVITPMVAGALVALYIAVEAPVSGMSMNPARTWASALAAQSWRSLWVYFAAPPLGMLTAGYLFRARRGIQSVFCAKLHHDNDQPCIFRCNYHSLKTEGVK